LKKIILASKSRDRSDIFQRSGIHFEVLITDVDEDKYKKQITDPISLAKELAKALEDIVIKIAREALDFTLHAGRIGENLWSGRAKIK